MEPGTSVSYVQLEPISALAAQWQGRFFDPTLARWGGVPYNEAWKGDEA